MMLKEITVMSNCYNDDDNNDGDNNGLGYGSQLVRVLAPCNAESMGSSLFPEMVIL